MPIRRRRCAAAGSSSRAVRGTWPPSTASTIAIAVDVLVKNQARGESVPVVRVGDPKAQVTHEAAIGTVDQTQLETLMAHGLTPDQAIELVISGMLRPAATEPA
ncbi:SufD family Fe-S cluster assembly protein [uncultured Thiohalocapsa sp.]|uniref:SufD family Fe-S cluster assembly protein n=1 Tax=uncultured Thiohalocapsa sp. TaxID=768990 RepID=UPI0025E2FFD0|nr:SufD family Fe-S cluster assembly protein [uncultured Thiohalocapsa sp.]